MSLLEIPQFSYTKQLTHLAIYADQGKTSKMGLSYKLCQALMRAEFRNFA